MSDWVKTFRGVVLASEYDAASHMNSRMYVSRFDQATWLLLHAIGLTPTTMKERRLRVAIVRQNFQFMRELRGGELVQVRSGFLAVGDKYFRFLHQMFDEEGGAMLATCDSVAVQAALDTSQSVPLEAVLRERAKAHLVTDNRPERALPG
ncbi:MAG: thioesterase family protein [Burkholderiaceae bacterium]|nr:thioesterase family protein [Burkholderiaceae bacterium]MCD6671686.1 thioesterase family protein [Burkholderiaceae bacterium]